MRQLKPETITTESHADEGLFMQCAIPTRAASTPDMPVQAVMWYYGELVRERRRELKITQQELAVKVGLRTGAISRVEKGEADILFSSFIRIMNALDLQIDLQY